jgi:hypothetical protein
MIYACLALLFTTPLSSLAQDRSVRTRLDNMVTEARAGNAITYDPSIYKRPANLAPILDYAATLSADTLYEVRRLACSFIAQSGKQAQIPEVRTRAVNMLLGTVSDKDSRIANTAADHLKQFVFNDFDSTARQTLGTLVASQPFAYATVLKLVGFLGMSTQTGIIRNKLNNAKLSNAEKWAANLALARLGNGDAINFCMNAVRQAGLNTDVTYDLLPDLVYTRQRQCFDYLVEVINDTRPLCDSPNPDLAGKIVCAYRVMEYVAPVIENFPLKVGPTGEIIAPDYPKALKTTRDWFRTHKDYKIMVTSF